MAARKSTARFARTAEHVRQSTSPRHLFAYASIAVCGLSTAAGAYFHLHQEATHPVTFGVGTDASHVGNRAVTLTARQNEQLSPAYQPLDPTPVFNRIQHSFFDSSLTIGTLGIGGAIAALGLPYLKFGRSRRLALSEGEIQHAMRTTSREDRASYNERNLEALDTIIDNPAPRLTPEEREKIAAAEELTRQETAYANVAGNIGLGPDAPARVVLDAIKAGLEGPSPLQEPIFIPTLGKEV